MNNIELEKLAGGALQEKAHDALEEVFKNMCDTNTPWKNKREVNIKLKLSQNEARNDSTMEMSVSTKLAQPKAIETKFAIGTDLVTGEVQAEEYGPSIKGQMNLSDYQSSQGVEPEVDEETGEILEHRTDAVINFKEARQA